jgi:carboxyl-terminal processing protease
VASVKDARLLPASMAGQDKIGYVRIEEFAENTSDELDHALEGLEHDGIQGLVIDLRNNPGGLLDSAVDVAGKFVPPNTVIVSTKGRTADQTQDFRARVQRQHPDYPIALLINGYSASGAEIVAGALKDLHRAILVGETTFGKGSVQTVQPLGNGVGLRLTMAKYYTPSKRKTIHEVGVSPDIEVPISDAEERRIVLAEELQVKVEHRRGEENAVDQVERAADAGDGAARILDRGVAFDDRFRQIPHHADQRQEQAENDAVGKGDRLHARSPMTWVKAMLIASDVRMAPAKPSQVLPGLMRGIILCRPMSEPTT